MKDYIEDTFDGIESDIYGVLGRINALRMDIHGTPSKPQDIAVGIDVTELGTQLVVRCGNEIIKSEFYHAPKREWVGLTDEERHSIREWQRIQEELGTVWSPMMLYLYEAIEAALRRKNT